MSKDLTPFNETVVGLRVVGVRIVYVYTYCLLHSLKDVIAYSCTKNSATLSFLLTMRLSVYKTRILLRVLLVISTRLPLVIRLTQRAFRTNGVVLRGF